MQFRPKLLTFLCLLLVMLAQRTDAQTTTQPRTGDSLKIAAADQPTDDAKTESTDSDLAGRVVILPLENGGVDAGLLFQTVAGDLHWTAGSVAGFARAFGVEATGNRLSETQVASMVERFPSVFSYQPVPETQRPGLAVNTAQLAQMLVDKKSNLRRWLASVDGQSLSALTKVDGTWPANGKQPLRIVIVTPGLHSPVQSADDMARVLHKRTNLPMCVFKYPNDGPIGESSQWLVEKLTDLHLHYPNSKFTLISHSMGGLVARGAIELPTSGAGSDRASFAARVGLDQLIQICPPNHGSGLSQYGPMLEGFEQLYNLVHRGRGGKRPRVLISMIADGFNEASADLSPDSDFLVRLNRSERDPNVRYTILAGDSGPLRPGMTSLLGGVWDRVAEAVKGPEAINLTVRDLLNCPELQNGLGDGVVSIESAKLSGVTDFELFHMNHLSWIELDSETGGALIDAIVGRLGVSL